MLRQLSGPSIRALRRAKPVEHGNNHLNLRYDSYRIQKGCRTILRNATQNNDMRRIAIQVWGTICDVGDKKSVEALANFAKEKCQTIHYWINNAGINGGRVEFMDVPVEQVTTHLPYSPVNTCAQHHLVRAHSTHDQEGGLKRTGEALGLPKGLASSRAYLVSFHTRFLCAHTYCRLKRW